MEHPVIPAPEHRDDDPFFPVVAYASTVQFAPHEETGFPCVMSRMFLSCVAGSGRVEVDGHRVDVGPGTIVVMPWRHRVRYRPDPADPYLVHGAHLVPRHRSGVAVELTVPHDRRHPLARSPDREDGPLATGPGLAVLAAADRPALATVLHYIAQVWDRSEPDVATAGALGALLVSELAAPTPLMTQDDRRLPVRLRRALAWVTADISRPVTVADLSAVADCSPATVTRLFRDELGVSPMAWVLAYRLHRAEELLTTTRLDVGQVALRVGIPDRSHFSRRFHAATGVAPSEWRQRRSAP